MQKHIAAADHRKNALKFLLFDGAVFEHVALGATQHRGCLARVGLVLEIRQWDSHQTEQIVEAQRTVNPVEIGFLNGHAIHQHLDNVLWHSLGDLEPHHFATHASFAQALLNGDHQIISFQVAQFQIRIPGDAEEVVPLDAHAWKEKAEVEGHHLLQGNGRVNCLRLFSCEVGGYGNESRQDRLRHLHAGQQPLTGVRIVNQSRHIQAEIAHEGKGMSRIHCQGG